MDQSRYCLNSHVLSSSFGDSWEEQAFAEDAAGPLGGCIWPPRSYTCSFCRREFRSAQALGGHMNVHRRDRAKLKQISGPNSNQVQVLLEPKPNTSLGTCRLQNPNLISNPNFDFGYTRPSTPSILRPFTCSFVQEQEKETPILSWNKSESRKRFLVSDLENQEKGCCTKIVESNSITSKNNNREIEVRFAGNLNSLVRKRYEEPIVNDTNDAQENLILKRRRVDHDDDFIPKNGNLVNGEEVESLVPVECSPNSTLENLDLELRLGT